jgi:hypothetical protein
VAHGGIFVAARVCDDNEFFELQSTDLDNIVTPGITSSSQECYHSFTLILARLESESPCVSRKHKHAL